MPSLTLKNLPAGLHKALKEAASRQRRSLNSEIIARLERSLEAPRFAPQAFLAVVERLDGLVKSLSLEEVQAFKVAGRP